MTTYPEVVTKIIDDYMDRLKSQLQLVPVEDRNEFLREIQSHIYEAFQQQDAGNDEVTRILTVLRKLGEPAEVVADRLPEAIAGSASAWILPLRIVGALLIALFGIPLGLGGMAVLLGILAALAGVLISYYVLASVALLASVVLLTLGMSRLYQPELWDRLLAAGVIQMDVAVAQVVDRLSPYAQGNLLIFFAIVCAAAAVGMFWSGRYLVRGVSFVMVRVFGWIRQFGQHVWRRVQPYSAEFFAKLQRA